MSEAANKSVPKIAQDAILMKSVPDTPFTKDAKVCKGFDFNGEVTLDGLMASYATTGFQATHVGRAIDEINKMLHWKPTQEMIDEAATAGKPYPKCTIFLGYTSNTISCGLREVVRYLAQHKLVDVIVTTTGGIEEDFIKCMAPTLIGEFSYDGATLRDNGLNRIGNLLVPNDNYCLFEDWMMPILDQLLKEQQEEGTVWSPSKIIRRLGKEINNEESVYYWCYKNDIPVYCPALTDGSIGDMIFFHSFGHPGLVVDLVQDIRGINSTAMNAACTGMIILGGGVIKHHICNANLMRNGADFTVYINTAQEFDGSDAGARPDEAVSWGKIKAGASAVKVYGESTVLFPLIVSQTFAKYVKEMEKKKKEEEADEAEEKK